MAKSSLDNNHEQDAWSPVFVSHEPPITRERYTKIGKSLDFIEYKGTTIKEKRKKKKLSLNTLLVDTN
ncbi:hypothetical protein [Candidatus Nitrosocosmicus arcticus]|uniref:Uncharacterized protein n=1 Tax=Candidatus Nitrosocosmicus arcticus TaxID=2035267 RepID=A0A557SWK2_9ARCH|nr:hypothetical protein [Candidatus Nitrosocosmicus arcticus]TVP40983.1 hypothetical protein NARC_50164 [Candidatus Nitrosocosmicus arcticus]